MNKIEIGIKLVIFAGLMWALLFFALNAFATGNYSNCHYECAKKIYGACVKWDKVCKNPTPTLSPTSTPVPSVVVEPTTTLTPSYPMISCDEADVDGNGVVEIYDYNKIAEGSQSNAYPKNDLDHDGDVDNDDGLIFANYTQVNGMPVVCHPQTPNVGGNTPQVNTDGGTAVCTTTESVDMPLLQGFARVNPTTVKYSWWLPNAPIDKLHIVYGYDMNSLQFGALNIGNKTTEFTINDLDPNRTVWAQVIAEKGACVAKSQIVDP